MKVPFDAYIGDADLTRIGASAELIDKTLIARNPRCEPSEKKPGNEMMPPRLIRHVNQHTSRAEPIEHSIGALILLTSRPSHLP